MRLSAVLLVTLYTHSLAESAKKVTCVSSLTGDFGFEACGAFCKQAKARNHCNFCKCRTCSFCPASGAKPAVSAIAPQPAPATKLPAPPAKPQPAPVPTVAAPWTKGKGRKPKKARVASTPAAVAPSTATPAKTSAAVLGGATPPPPGVNPLSLNPITTVLLLIGMCSAAALIWMRVCQDNESDKANELRFDDLDRERHQVSRVGYQINTAGGGSSVCKSQNWN